jgi:hypothetical protein
MVDGKHDMERRGRCDGRIAEGGGRDRSMMRIVRDGRDHPATGAGAATRGVGAPFVGALAVPLVAVIVARMLARRGRRLVGTRGTYELGERHRLQNEQEGDEERNDMGSAGIDVPR